MQSMEQSEELTYYDVLNVAREATAEDIKKAYHRLAQAFHPDKQSSEELRATATGAFSDIQEAYEVLSDSNTRQIYDVYGQLGLQAGLEVGTKFKDLDEVKKEWATFQAQQAAQRYEAEAAPHALVRVEIFAVRTVKDLWQGCLPNAPIVKTCTMQSSVDFNLAEAHSASIGGVVAMATQRRSDGGLVMAGTSSFPARYSCSLTPADQLQLDVSYSNDKSNMSISTVRQLSAYDIGQASITYTSEGAGLQVVSKRTIDDRTSAAFTWVLGPQTLQGMSLHVVRRYDKASVSAKLEVGSDTSISGRCSYKISKGLSLRTVARCGTGGINAEVGVWKKWSDLMSGYASVLHGLMGTTIKLRLTRAGHTFDMPIIVTRDWQDWQSLLIAFVAPPLISHLLHRCVVRPVLSVISSQRAARLRLLLESELRAIKEHATSKQLLLAPMVKRLARQEVRSHGVVILEAAYGELDQYKVELQRRIASCGHDAAVSGTEPNGTSSPPHSGASGAYILTDDVATPADVPHDNGTSEYEEPSEPPSRTEQPEAATNTRPTYPDTPCTSDPWLDVTVAMQYQVVEHRVDLVGRLSKAKLLGFADVAPESSKHLSVIFWHNKNFFRIEVDDQSKLELPSSRCTRLTGAEEKFAQSLAAATDLF